MIPTYPLKIQKKIWETRDSVSLVLEPPLEHQNLFIYTPAQFLTFHFHIEGRKYHRSYSLSSCPLLKEELKTTVKRVQDGLISSHIIDSLKEGDIILSRKPAGRFFKPPTDLKPKNYFLFAGGSGITPLFSILKTALVSDLENKVTLFYANRDEDSIIYKKEIKYYLSKHKNNFRCFDILSRPKESWCAIRERLNPRHLEKYLPLPSPVPVSDLFYLCGPAGFMQTVENFLTTHKVPPRQIRKESFVSPKSEQKSVSSHAMADKVSPSVSEVAPAVSSKASPCSAPSVAGGGKVVIHGTEGKSPIGKPLTIKARLDGQNIEVKAGGAGDIPILEQLLAAGHAPPFSCLSGSCMSCLAVLKKGCIQQQERGILEDENIGRHEILTCQALPQSAVVEVDYDDL